MKRLTRCICIILAITVLLTATVYAEENTSSRASNYFMSCSVFLDQTTDNAFRACFDVTALGVMDVLGASEIKIQRSSDGKNWTTTRTFTKEDYPQLVDEDQITHGSYITYAGLSGYYYRAKIVLYAKNSSGVAESTQYTSKIFTG